MVAAPCILISALRVVSRKTGTACVSSDALLRIIIILGFPQNISFAFFLQVVLCNTGVQGSLFSLISFYSMVHGGVGFQKTKKKSPPSTGACPQSASLRQLAGRWRFEEFVVRMVTVL